MLDSKPPAFIIRLRRHEYPVLQVPGVHVNAYFADIPTSLVKGIERWPIECISDMYLKLAQVIEKTTQYLSGVVVKAYERKLSGKPLIILAEPEIADFISCQYINLLETRKYRREAKERCVIKDILTCEGKGGVKISRLFGSEILN